MSTMKSAATALAKAVGIYGSKTASARDIAAEIATLAGGQAQRDAALAQATEDRRVAVLSGNAAKATSAETALAAARREMEHAEILLDGLQKRLAQAEAAEAEAVRQERYDRALALQKGLLKDMPVIIGRMREDAQQIASRLSAAEELIEEANFDLPAGKAPIADPDLIVRGQVGAAEEIVEDGIVQCWCWEGSTRRIPENDIGNVQRRPGDEADRGYISFNGNVRNVERRPFRRERYRASVPHDQPDPIKRDFAALLKPPRPPMTKAERPILERFTPA